VHDIVNLEGRGLPVVGVATVQFQSAAEAQGKALGFEPAMIYVEHPIQDRTQTEIAKIAQRALPTILQMLTTG